MAVEDCHVTVLWKPELDHKQTKKRLDTANPSLLILQVEQLIFDSLFGGKMRMCAFSPQKEYGWPRLF